LWNLEDKRVALRANHCLAGRQPFRRRLHRPARRDLDVRCPDISKATAALGWVPPIRLADGLERTIEWVRSATAA
jgi:nucleoside-diphosphate-sugar epimerase